VSIKNYGETKMQQYKLNDQVRNGFLSYQRVEELLKKSTTPLTRRQIYESASVRDVTPKEHTIGDVIKAFSRDGLIRRVPYYGAGAARFAYEWVGVSNKKPVAEIKKPVAEIKKPVAEIKKPTAKENIAKTIDMVNNPPHYTNGGIETIDFIKAKLTPDEYRGFLKGTCIKYASRLGNKLNTDDAGKLAWYANKLGER
jgi:hypothetical protein